MRFYFRLRFTLLKRQLEDAGLPAWVGLLFALACYVFLAFQVQRYMTIAPFAILAIGFFAGVKLSNKQQDELLKSNFPTPTYRKIRLLEQFLPIIPLLIICMIYGFYTVFLALVLFHLLLYFFPLRLGSNKYYLSFFPHHPFEFTQGLRRFIGFYVLAYCFGGIGLAVDNPNLILASFLLIAIKVLSIYDYIEPEPYIWNYNRSPASFLAMKIARGCGQHLLLFIPLFVMLLFSPFYHQLFALAILLLFLLALGLLILIKYAIYPREKNIPEAMIFAIAVGIPIFIFFLYPYYFRKATQNLKLYLC